MAHPLLPSRPHGTGVKGWLVSPRRIHAGSEVSASAAWRSGRAILGAWTSPTEGRTWARTDGSSSAHRRSSSSSAPRSSRSIARNLGKAQGEFKKGLKEGAVERRLDLDARGLTDPAGGPPTLGSRRPAPASSDQPEGDQPTA